MDAHVARWRDWDEISFEPEVEGVVTRIAELARHLRRAKEAAMVDVGLQGYEYDTLHALMIRDTPGTATPTELATRLRMSAAGMTGRLDGLESLGMLKRVRSVADRRRIDVAITAKGRDRWRRAMRLRGVADDDMVVPLSQKEQRQLNALLRRMLHHIEDE